MARSSLLLSAFVWAPYICMGKMLIISAFVWAPYICMETMLIISNGFSSEASGPVLLKFHAEPLWAGE